MSLCVPCGADWTCAYSPDELLQMRLDDATSAVMDRAEALAWATISALTAYRISTCPVMIRPCLRGCDRSTWYVAPAGDGNSAPSGSLLSPYISEGAWYNGCGCTTDCSCTSLCEVILPGEVASIDEVWLNGERLPSSAYRVDNGNRLVRTDGECWPSCQDMSQSEEGPDAFAVSYYPGVAPNDMITYAVGVLASEFYLACKGKDCRLPNGVTSITRAGISMEIPTGMFVGGSTGIAEVDAVIRIYNPHGLKSRPRVLSPDRSRGRIKTWGA